MSVFTPRESTKTKRMLEMGSDTQRPVVGVDRGAQPEGAVDGGATAGDDQGAGAAGSGGGGGGGGCAPGVRAAPTRVSLSFKDSVRLASEALGPTKDAMDVAVAAAVAAFAKAKTPQQRKWVINTCLMDLNGRLMEGLVALPDEACSPDVQRTVIIPLFDRLRRIGAGTPRDVVNGSGGYFLDTVTGALGPVGSDGELAKRFPLEWFLWAMHVMLCSGEPVVQALPEVVGGITADPDLARAYLWQCLQRAKWNKLQRVGHVLSRLPDGVEHVMTQLEKIESYRDETLVGRLRLSFGRDFGMHPDLDGVFDSTTFLSTLTTNVWQKLLESHVGGYLQQYQQPVDLEAVNKLLYHMAVEGRAERERRAIDAADAAMLSGGAAAGGAMSVNAMTSGVTADGAGAGGGGVGAGGGRAPRKCFKCDSTDHLSWACPTVKCHICGEVGHLKARCPKKSDSGDNDTKGGKTKGGKCVICVICHEEGHYAKDCPNKEEVAKAVKAAMAAKKKGGQGGGGGGTK